jgi:hypothetical protein
MTAIAATALSLAGISSSVAHGSVITVADGAGAALGREGPAVTFEAVRAGAFAGGFAAVVPDTAFAVGATPFTGFSVTFVTPCVRFGGVDGFIDLALGLPTVLEPVAVFGTLLAGVLRIVGAGTLAALATRSSVTVRILSPLTSSSSSFNFTLVERATGAFLAVLGVVVDTGLAASVDATALVLPLLEAIAVGPESP